jgi:hypothetical protein
MQLRPIPARSGARTLAIDAGKISCASGAPYLVKTPRIEARRPRG